MVFSGDRCVTLRDGVGLGEADTEGWGSFLVDATSNLQASTSYRVRSPDGPVSRVVRLIW